MDNPPEHWDVAILGTGLSESILAAALAKAGKKVLHLDENDYYGGDSASLTLLELITWADERSKAPPPEADQQPSRYNSAQRKIFTDLHYSFPSSPDPSTPDPEFMKNSREYAISLLPCLVPASGPIIASLIASGVSRYGGFCLLNAVAVCSPRDEQRLEEAWDLAKVPASKEDVFKDRSMGLLDKRKLMKFLMFAASDAENPPELEGHEDTPFLEFLERKFSLPKSAASAIAFATAHCSHTGDKTVPALQRLRRYLRANGRYGNSPFLIGHYGGAGEMAQGFCRTAAVQGATYILGRKIDSIEHMSEAPAVTEVKTESGDVPTGPHYSIRLDGFTNPVTADVVVSTSSYNKYVDGLNDHPPQADSAVTTYLVRAVAVLDSPIKLAASTASAAPNPEESGSETIPVSETPGTCLVVFPPITLNGRTMEPVSALVMGDVSLSCPSDRYLVYLTTIFTAHDPSQSPPNPSSLLEPFLNRILYHSENGAESKPLFVCYFNQLLPSQTPSTNEGGSLLHLNSAPPLDAPLTEAADQTTQGAERIFWEIIKRNPEDAEEIQGFWPAVEPDAHESTSMEEEW